MLALVLLLHGCPEAAPQATPAAPPPSGKSAEANGDDGEQPQSPVAAGDALEQACDDGEPQACFRLAERLMGAGSAAQVRRGEALLAHACSLGSQQACDAMGH